MLFVLLVKLCFFNYDTKVLLFFDIRKLFDRKITFYVILRSRLYKMTPIANKKKFFFIKRLSNLMPNLLDRAKPLYNPPPNLLYLFGFKFTIYYTSVILFATSTCIVIRFPILRIETEPSSLIENSYPHLLKGCRSSFSTSYISSMYSYKVITSS